MDATVGTCIACARIVDVDVDAAERAVVRPHPGLGVEVCPGSGKPPRGHLPTQTAGGIISGINRAGHPRTSTDDSRGVCPGDERGRT